LINFAFRWTICKCFLEFAEGVNLRLSKETRGQLFWSALQRCFTAMFILGSIATAAQAQKQIFAPEIVGSWFTKSQSIVTIEPCNEGYCGVLTKVVIPQFLKDKYGTDIRAMEGNYIDALNKDPALRQRQVLGLKILVLRDRSDKNRIDGTIYNPEDGETYNGFMEVIDANNIRLSGCILFNLICMGEDWVRVSSASAPR